jgi:hypothetical protein
MRQGGRIWIVEEGVFGTKKGGTNVLLFVPGGQ